jgi:hypothetical protein
MTSSGHALSLLPEAGLPLVSTEWAREQTKAIRQLSDIANLPIPDPDQRLAIQRACDGAASFLVTIDDKTARTVMAPFDTMPRRRAEAVQSDFHLSVYCKAIIHAGISQWALEKAVMDFLTDVAGSGFVPSPPELIRQANIYMSKARWKVLVYKTWLEQPAWLRRPETPSERTIEDWMIKPAEVEEYNGLMRRLRLKMRATDEGWPYMLILLAEQEIEDA